MSDSKTPDINMEMGKCYKFEAMTEEEIRTLTVPFNPVIVCILLLMQDNILDFLHFFFFFCIFVICVIVIFIIVIFAQWVQFHDKFKFNEDGYIIGCCNKHEINGAEFDECDKHPKSPLSKGDNIKN